MPLVRAVQAHAEALAATTEGRIAQAEESWARASLLERESRTRRRAWVRGGRGGTSGVGRRRRRLSRYDPRPAPTVRARIACAHPGCRAEQEVSFPPTYALHAFTCVRLPAARSPPTSPSRARCARPSAPFGRRLSFRLEPLGGGALAGRVRRRLRRGRSTPRGATCWPSSTRKGRCCAGSPTSPPAGRSGGGGPVPAGSRPRPTARAPASWTSSGRAGTRRLLPTRMGRAAVACYDRCSPWMVRWLEHRPRTPGLGTAGAGRAGAEDRVTTSGGSEETAGGAAGAAPRRFPVLPVALLALGIAGLLWSGHPGGAPCASGATGPRPAPPFRLEKFGGGSVSSSELRGKVVMLDFWATWCRAVHRRDARPA